MRLIGKHILMIVTDGVDRDEYVQLKEGFESEQATVIVTSPQNYLTVETIQDGRRGEDILIDVPFDALEGIQFDGLVIPDGILSSDFLKKDKRVLHMVLQFHKKRLPIFASGNAVQVLYETQVLFSQVVVRESTPLPQFLDKAVEVLLDHVPFTHVYRPTMVL